MDRENFCLEADRLTGLGIPYVFLTNFEGTDFRLFPDPQQLSGTKRGFGGTNFRYFPGPVASPGLSPLVSDHYNLHIPQLPDFNQFLSAFRYVQQHQRNGDSWLANLCLATQVRLPDELNHQTALCDIAEWAVSTFSFYFRDQDGYECCCFSPEPFVKMENADEQSLVHTWPMKGTRTACLDDGSEDTNAAQALLTDPKELAEHITVVDLLRNDLGMISNAVSVPRFRYCERVRTSRGDLWATSSHIQGVLPPDWQHHAASLLCQLLPAGSVSGAPKQRTVALLQQAEAVKRGWYTGVVGHFDGQTLYSRICIRFLERHKSTDQHCWFRSGAGITIYSDADSEYQEIINKIYLPPLWQPSTSDLSMSDFSASDLSTGTVLK